MAKQDKKKSAKPASVIGGYVVVPVVLPNTDGVVHYLYARKHETPGQTEPSRTLFLANLPIDATTLHISLLFSSLVKATGTRAEITIETVTFLPSPTGTTFDLIPALSSLKAPTVTESAPILRILPTCSAAHVVFRDAGVLETVFAALAVSHTSSPPSWQIPPTRGATGTSRYRTIHNRRYISAATLQATVDNYIAAYGKAEREKERAAKRMRNEPDEDGFVTVSRFAGSRSNATSAVTLSADVLKEEAKKRREKAQLPDFYRFQIREQKKNKMNDLLKKFRMDQDKIRELKSKRRFKPFNNALA
ncbi:ribosomal RNA-processing protein 7-domain-containing protein [Limtongia smithiae]|uniref:ribosomal RNA-processing protein 7-domain-containing protein n=1 Tax=Limtongia smithiae TaxID=1125753 RepID=UPI0034CEBF78